MDSAGIAIKNIVFQVRVQIGICAIGRAYPPGEGPVCRVSDAGSGSGVGLMLLDAGGRDRGPVWPHPLSRQTTAPTTSVLTRIRTGLNMVEL
jgi:hypothetical protein